MKCKRKRACEDDVDRRAKRQRRRKRSSSEPSQSSPPSPEKRQALRRLFGRVGSLEAERERGSDVPSDTDSDGYTDENEDPLLDSVPVHMDPEQLGFLVCAQETLRFLHTRGIPVQHPVFARLRSRLLRGIGEMALA